MLSVTDILRGKGAPFGALFTYPVKVYDYEKFSEAKTCLTIMQKALPVEYIQMPYLHMLALVSTEGNNLMAKLSTVLSLALHLDEEQIRLRTNEGNLSLVFVNGANEPIETVSALRFSALRRQIAEQNHVELPNEHANMEILQSERDIAEANALGLITDFQSLFFSVATVCHLSAAEVMDMTIYEFEERYRAASRIMNYQIYKKAEMRGMVSFTGGSPFPSWCFDKKEDGLHGTIPLADFQKRVGNVIEDRTI